MKITNFKYSNFSKYFHKISMYENRIKIEHTDFTFPIINQTTISKIFSEWLFFYVS